MLQYVVPMYVRFWGGKRLLTAAHTEEPTEASPNSLSRKFHCQPETFRASVPLVSIIADMLIVIITV